VTEHDETLAPGRPRCEAIVDPNDDEDALPCGRPAVGVACDGTPLCDDCSQHYAKEEGGGVALYADDAFGPPRPQVIGFEYQVRIAVSLPRAWTTLLKQIAARHYDYQCRESGDHGVINGLHNTACDGDFPSSSPVSWRDLDLITKVMEQAPNMTVARQIDAFLLKYKRVIERRQSQIEAQDAKVVERRAAKQRGTLP
jgi:hypothetical protein